MKKQEKLQQILVIHGPNLNMLGLREPEVYGSTTLDEINEDLLIRGRELGFDIDCFQSNHEGAIVEKIQESMNRIAGLIINPAAYTHTSVAIRDALLLLEVPIVEIHLSNTHKREEFRHKSLMADIASAQLMGFGATGYRLALEGLNSFLKI